MARNINDLYNFYRYIVRKQRGVFVSITEFTTNLDTGQLDAFEEYFSLYGKDQRVHDAIRPFRVYQTFTSDADGFVTFPADYKHQLGLAFTIYGSATTEPTLVNEDELPNALKNQARPITNEYPIIIDTDVGFSVYPQTTQIGAYFYLRRPAVPLLSHTQVGRVITYIPGASTQLEWDEVYWNNIIAKALKYAAVNMDEKAVYEFAQQYNAETQEA